MRTRPRRRTRTAWAIGAASGALLLSGCGSLPPGAASVVNGHTITRAEVDQVAAAQCAGVRRAAQQGQGQVVARKQLTQQALGLLIDVQLNLDYGRSLGLRPRAQQAAAEYAQAKQLIATLPERYRAELQRVFQQWADGRDLITQVGEQATGQTATGANTEQVLNAGYAKRQAWLEKDASITTDARYSPGKVGWPGEGDSSVSRPVSSYAKSATAQQPSTAFLAALPESQRCG